MPCTISSISSTSSHPSHSDSGSRRRLESRPGERSMITRLISGGQTGADRAALDAARELGIETGGWVPRDRRAEDGRVPERYPNMKETDSADPAVRTECNVRDSDGTVVFSHGEVSGGTKWTVEVSGRLRKPRCASICRRSRWRPQRTGCWSGQPPRASRCSTSRVHGRARTRPSTPRCTRCWDLRLAVHRQTVDVPAIHLRCRWTTQEAAVSCIERSISRGVLGARASRPPRPEAGNGQSAEGP